jgi:hypothetical protein
VQSGLLVLNLDSSENFGNESQAQFWFTNPPEGAEKILDNEVDGPCERFERGTYEIQGRRVTNESHCISDE